MKIGFLFPGQGSQYVGMGKDLYDSYDSFRKVYEDIKRITAIDVAEISFEDSDNKLNQTQYTQMCILAMSLGLIEILKENGVKAEISAGLSLGEYSALVYSNLLSFEDGVKLVQKRGEYMQNLVPEGNWSMAAIIGLDDEKVEEACTMVNSGFVVPVNYNCVGQVVISGETKAVEEAGANAKELGAKIVKVLNTSGPFHTEKLIDSAKALRKDLDEIDYKKLSSKVIRNLDGSFYEEDDNYPEILMKHIVSPVKFSKSLNTMLDEKIDTFVEIGPGRTLSGFLKRMPKEREITILNINDVSSLEKVLNFVKENRDE